MQKSSSISRRDFIKLSGMGLLGIFSTHLSPLKQLSDQQQGRVIYENISVYKKPSFESERVRLYWKDMIVPITKATIGDKEPSYNRVWYRISSGGYAHSGGIQPVRTLPNPVVEALPSEGALAEVTVPFTDALWNANLPSRVAYRFYYETTHWVNAITHASDGRAFYEIKEDKWDLIYYVPAAHLRIIPREELAMLSPHVPSFAKRIEIRTDLQLVIAYEWNRPVFVSKAATGAVFSTGHYSTPPGRHIVNYKRPSRHMAAGNLAYNGYDLPGVPWTTYFTEKGVALHGTYWHNDFGKPRSHGCINLPSRASKWFYLWTNPHVPPEKQWAYEESGTAIDVLPVP
ncbi:MAG: hypothetical protein DRI56_02350 [Chloroflexota bacterium]|nr:MAG: hypothetical protein DRI56_02350 [Chloroflexota bacterium]